MSFMERRQKADGAVGYFAFPDWDLAASKISVLSFISVIVMVKQAPRRFHHKIAF
jgi:hypothetical protein